MRRFENIHQLVPMDGEIEILSDAALLVEGAQVVALGPREALAERPADEVVDLGGRVVLPGLVECHTHVVYGGERRRDFADRCAGVSYEAIAARGGGILTTVRATRAASEDELLAAALPRLDALLASGATTVEVKSGYGLDMETELKMLRVIRRLDEAHAVDVVGTFLGAHTVPTAFGVERERYLSEVVNEMIPEVARQKLASFCDVFCESTAFSVEESRRVLEAGLAHGLRPKVHAEQLTPSGGGRLAAELGALSADHLEFTSAEDIAALADAGTVATLLPGATLFLGMTRYAPARDFLAAGVEVALSTDCNPGSSNTTDLFLMGTLGCTQMGLSPLQSLRALTRGGAKALGREERIGSLAAGRQADFIVLDVDDVVDAVYRMGARSVRAVYKGGEQVFSRSATL